MPRRISGRGIPTTLTIFCLFALLAGTPAGCQVQSPSPLPTPSGEAAAATPTLSPAEIQARAAAGEWLRANAIPFETTEPGSGFEDLMPLKEMIGDARIVALGEATHGTHEFFQMKHRLVEFLVEEMGFNVFAMEVDWAEANSVNDYVQNGPCRGNEAKLLADLGYWTWNTEEVLDMIRWMCVHNQDPGDAPKVSFAGFDMQNPDMAITSVISYLQKVEPSYVEIATSRYSCLRGHRGVDYAGLPDADQAVCRNGLQEVFDHLIAQRETYEELSSPQKFAVAEQSARVVLQAADWFAEDTFSRDQYLAENVTWLLEQAGPDARIILWAHNGHVGNMETSDTPAWKSMGAYLREIYGEEMVTFGFAFYQGRFNAISYDPETGEYGALLTYRTLALQGSYEWYFKAAEMPRMLLDLRDVSSTSPTTDWLMGPHKFRSIGSIYHDHAPEEYYDANLTTEFDAIIYFDETTPSVLLPFQQ